MREAAGFIKFFFCKNSFDKIYKIILLCLQIELRVYVGSFSSWEHNHYRVAFALGLEEVKCIKTPSYMYAKSTLK